jgi:hypothetical protein
MTLGKLLIIGVICGAWPAAALPVLALDPIGGALIGAPGDTRGWGFQLTNDVGYLVITSANYTAAATVGIFDPFIILPQNFAAVGPGETWSQTFNPSVQAGVAAYHINDFEIPGTVSSGVIELTYDLFAVSPFDAAFDPSRDTISVGNILSTDASVTVGSPTAPVPEPGTAVLFLVAIALGVAHRAGGGRAGC